MRRYWVEQNDFSSSEFDISGEVFHHVFDVCRQTVGDKFEVIVGDGKAYLVEVISVLKKMARVRVLNSREIEKIKKPFLNLCLSVPRFAVIESIIEKSVELGVARIQPFYSEFSFVKANEKVSENRIERWKKIVKSATQQSGRGDLLHIEDPVTLSELLKKFNQSERVLGLFCYEGEGRLSLSQWIESTSKIQDLDEIWIFIGSEGGFSSVEIQRFQQLSLPPVTLGPQVLRVETACVSIVGILKYEWNLFE